jgi:hypothetical protein
MFNYAQAEFEVNPKTLMTCPQFLKTVEEFPNSAYNQRNQQSLHIHQSNGDYTYTSRERERERERDTSPLNSI